MLDAGSGLGGPAAWLARHFGVTPVCAEPMRGAARASRRLFGLPTVAASGQALPFPDGPSTRPGASGCSTPPATRPAALLAELQPGARPRRPARPARLPRRRPAAAAAAEGNEFSTAAELGELLTGAGFRTRRSVPAPSLRDAPADWRAHADRVEEVLAARHGEDPRWVNARSRLPGWPDSSGWHLRPTLLLAVAV